MKRADPTLLALFAATLVLLVLGLFLPRWLFLFTLSLGKGLVVLGLMLLLRTGLVSFGQGLFYCLGAYAVGSLGQFFGTRDVLLSLLTGLVVGSVAAFALGFLMAKYRDIFFAMLSLAFSMILYGLLVKTAALGSTDGFNVTVPVLFHRPIGGEAHAFALFAVACVLALLAALAMHKYFATPLGRLSPAIRDNEIRVEYMGASVRHAVHVKYVIAGALAGLGGALTAMTVGHIDPDLAYWTTSGEFIFVAILSGTGSVIAPFLGSLVFEIIRTYAYQYSPNTWQLVVGSALLIVIVFFPAGLWSVFGYTGRRGTP
jgi:ABC-type branched-subunit amino acid transport system permease subunit